ncbi:hypothetical protein FQA47_016653 [Oryzias melastigma]|uniref:Uncharacterized protein n=1 Tax=Oryzias melastigma TaxID=30732 RepID=A0A834BM21_ORYME|nr:hypothetical protein FQA47_016653 [Oryzias melastigma]
MEVGVSWILTKEERTAENPHTGLESPKPEATNDPPVQDQALETPEGKSEEELHPGAATAMVKQFFIESDAVFPGVDIKSISRRIFKKVYKEVKDVDLSNTDITSRAEKRRAFSFRFILPNQSRPQALHLIPPSTSFSGQSVGGRTPHFCMLSLLSEQSMPQYQLRGKKQKTYQGRGATQAEVERKNRWRGGEGEEIMKKT